MRRSVTVRVLSLLALFALASGGAGAQQALDANRSVPAGTLVYLSVDANAVLEYWERLQAAPALQGIFSESSRAASRSGMKELLALLGQGFESQVTLALADEEFTPPQPPSLVAVLPARGADEARSLVKLFEMKLAADKAEIQTRDYQGATIRTVSGGPFQRHPISYVLLEDRLLIGTRPAWLEKAVDTASGRGPSISADPRFERVRARLTTMGPAAAWFWMDVQRLQARALESAMAARQAPPAGEDAAPMPPPFPPVNLEALREVMGAYDSIGGRLLLSPRGITVQGLTLVDPANEFGRKLLAQKAGPLASARLASANTVAFFAFNNLPTMMEMFRLYGDAVAAPLQQMLANVGQSFHALTGLDPQADILRHVGSEVALALNDIPGGPRSVPVLLYVGTSNKLALGISMQKMRARLTESGVKFVEKELPQGRLYALEPGKTTALPFAPGWTFAGDFLVLSATADALKTPLFLASGSGNSLAAAPAYQEATAADAGRLLGVLYINLAKMTALADRFGKSTAQPDQAGPDRAQALKALRSLTGVWAMETDALTYRMELALDLEG